MSSLATISLRLGIYEICRHLGMHRGVRNQRRIQNAPDDSLPLMPGNDSGWRLPACNTVDGAILPHFKDVGSDCVCSGVAHQALLLALPVAFLDGFALVMVCLALGEGYFALDHVLLPVQGQGHAGIALGLNRAG